VSEAVAAGVPVVSTRIDGSIGLLGEDYPGYVEVGDAAGLARALEQVATDQAFRAELTRQVRARRHLFTPDRERQAWADLLAWLGDSSAGQPA
jgi:glycosyltransferase involved in cell wall biosynthesis